MPRTDPTTPPSGNTGTAPVSRLRALDGLRGVAAVVVLLHHAFLTVPALARPDDVTEAADRDSPLVWALIHTPLHLGWAGTEAVYIFFVLSGLVLALPVLRSESFSWLEYFPRRAARLYLPVAAAVLWGLLLVWRVPRDNTGARWARWVVARPNLPSWSGVGHDLTLLGGESHLISPFWLLQWELWFSLLLPLYVLGVVLVRRLPLWVPVAGLVAMVAAGVFLDNKALVHLPMFAIGAVIASRLPELTQRAASIRPRGWALAGVAATVLVTAHWWLLALTTNLTVLRFGTPLALLGATGYVLTVALCPQVQRWGIPAVGHCACTRPEIAAAPAQQSGSAMRWAIVSGRASWSARTIGAGEQHRRHAAAAGHHACRGAGRGPVGGVVDAQRVAALPARHARDPVVAERRHQRSRGTRQQPRAMRRGMDREAGVPPDGTQAGGRTGGQARLGARPMVTERLRRQQHVLHGHATQPGAVGRARERPVVARHIGLSEPAARERDSARGQVVRLPAR